MDTATAQRMVHREWYTEIRVTDTDTDTDTDTGTGTDAGTDISWLLGGVRKGREGKTLYLDENT